MSFLVRPIYKAIRTELFKHYTHNVDIREVITDEKNQQQKSFIDLIAETPIMKKLFEFLQCNGMLSVKFTGVVAHWQKLRDCFLKAIVPGRLYLCMSVCVARYVIRDGDLG